MPADKPNVLVLMSDQHHPRILGCAGDELVQTPNMDRIAAEGARFSSVYCNYPLCCPSRMSFMSSKLPTEIDCCHNASQLSSDVPTFAHAFLRDGWQTVLSGRMHFVGMDQRHGFEQRIIGDCGPTAYITDGFDLEPVLGDLIDTPGYSRQGVLKSGPGRSGYQAYDEAVCETTVRWLRDRATGHVASADDRPFMMTAGFVLPHCPFVAPPDDFHRYWDAITEDDLPRFDRGKAHPYDLELRRRARLDPEPLPLDAQRRTRVAYYGMVTFLDRLVGRILDALDETGLAENTIVVYTSDHGELLGEHGLWWKSSFYEGSIGIPMVARWPGRITPGSVVPQNVSLLDVGPTLLDLCEARPLPNPTGRSFAGLLEGDEASWDDTVLAENFAPTADPAPQRMIRRGPWKYCYYHGQRPQLFNVEQDPQERHDLADDMEHASVVAELNSRLFAGWDPEAVARRYTLSHEARAMHARWVRHADPPEPDAPWFGDTPPENRIDPVA